MNQFPAGNNPGPGGYPPGNQLPPQPQTVSVGLPRVRPVVTYSIIVVTTAIFILQLVDQTQFNQDILFYWGGKINQAIYLGQLWRLLTPMLLHGTIEHILFNMYALYVFGRELEMAYGHSRFLLLYVLGGFAGNVLSFFFTPGPSLGSSTAIFGLVAAQAVFAYQNRKLFGSRTRSMLLQIGFIVLLNLGIGLAPGSMIDNMGHLGGFLGGALFAWFAGPRWKIEGLYPALHVEDTTENAQVLLGAFIVIFVFGGLTVLRFLIR
jgi:rhomboid protease GluP